MIQKRKRKKKGEKRRKKARKKRQTEGSKRDAIGNVVWSGDRQRWRPPKAAFIEQRETHRCIKSILHRREPSVRHDTSVKHDRETRLSVFCNMRHATVAAASHFLKDRATDQCAS